MHLTEDLDSNVLSGYDSEAPPVLLTGGTGVTSASANVFAKDIVNSVEAAFEKDVDEAVQLQRKMIEVEKTVRRDNPPIAHKKTVELLGYQEANVRPLYDIDPATTGTGYVRSSTSTSPTPETDYCDSVRQCNQRIAVSCSNTAKLLRRGGTESQ